MKKMNVTKAFKAIGIAFLIAAGPVSIGVFVNGNHENAQKLLAKERTRVCDLAFQKNGGELVDLYKTALNNGVSLKDLRQLKWPVNSKDRTFDCTYKIIANAYLEFKK